MSGYESLSVERQIELHTALATSALGRWGLAEARLDLLKHRENTVFKVTAPDGERYAMRVHRPGYRSDAQLRSELEWLDSLRAEGVGTTETKHCLDGSIFARVTTEALTDGRQCDLLGWVPGKPLGSIEEGVPLDGESLSAAYQRVGEQAARIHNHGETWKRPAGFTRFAWDEESYFGETALMGRYWDLEMLTPDQLELLHAAKKATADTFAKFGKGPDRYGLIHGDFLPENLFLDGDEVRLIDWDDTGFGWHMDDFATAMLAHIGRPTFEGAFAAMAAGYRQRRSLPDEHLALLPFFLMARGLSYVGWAHSRGEAGKVVASGIVGDACRLASALVA